MRIVGDAVGAAIETEHHATVLERVKSIRHKRHAVIALDQAVTHRIVDGQRIRAAFDVSRSRNISPKQLHTNTGFNYIFASHRKRRLGILDSGDIPVALREQNCKLAAATAQIQRPAGFRAELGFEERFEMLEIHRRPSRSALIPYTSIHHFVIVINPSPIVHIV
jgi:hypothetical protein